MEIRMIYTYSKTDTANGVVALVELNLEIGESSILIALNNITLSGEDINVDFKDDLTPGDITTLDGVIASHSGVEYTSNEEVITAITEPFSAKTLPTGENLFKRMHGSDIVDILPGESETMEIEIGYPWAKIEAMEMLGCGESHTCSLHILDSQNNDYSKAPVGVVGEHYKLNQFAYDINLRKDYHRLSSKYDADLYLGMVVQLVVTNNSQEASKVSLNIELNEVVG
jgi:hypothetical protein